MNQARPAVLSLLAAAALLSVGCGSTALLSSRSHSRASASARRLPQFGPRGIPAPAPTGRPADAGAVKVIEGWSSALRRGDVHAAARYFQLPSELVNGVAAGGALAVVRIRDLADAEAANETLPCGAQFVSADQRGRYVNALFTLTGRPGPGGSDCGSSTGVTARTNFLIADGRIVAWIRAPDDPGDNGSPATPGGSGRGSPLV